MTAQVLLLSLVLGNIEMVPLDVPPVTIRVPVTWDHSVSGGTHYFSVATDDAKFMIDASVVKGKPMSPEACRDKILNRLGPEGWEMINVGGLPAAAKQQRDFDPQTRIEAYTFTYVGCDGKNTWSLMFYMNGYQPGFQALLNQMVASIRYLKTDPEPEKPKERASVAQVAPASAPAIAVAATTPISKAADAVVKAPRIKKKPPSRSQVAAVNSGHGFVRDP